MGDSHPRILPSVKNCGIEQIAVYSDGSEQIHIVGGVWDQMSNLHKAALLIHEALYRNLREFGDTNSDRTRNALGYLFGGMKFEWVLEGLPEKWLFCWTTDDTASFQFAAYPVSDDLVAAQFLVFDGDVMLTKTIGNLDIAPFASMFGLKTPVRGGGARKTF